MSNQKPSVGRVVHYMLPNGEARPAFIVRVNESGGPTTCNLQVFTDGNNDADFASGKNTKWVGSVAESVEPGGRIGKWMWPPFVAPKPAG